MIPDGAATKIATVIKELGGISFECLWTMLQWDGLRKEESDFVVKVLKRYRVIEEKNGVLLYAK